ncbi:MAG: PD-(D/E)XK nuclease family protein [Acidobacteriota bacterium]|nr:PD-(D/E)XK nuclease family protein [Acidobacteriota bacterium]
MITPRNTRLLRVPDLQALHATVARCATGERGESLEGRVADAGAIGNPLHSRACAVVVPTRGAAEALRRTLENLWLTDRSPALVLPDLVTRGELYERLHRRARGAPPRLTDFEREVIFRRAAVDASGQGTPPPFRLRPGLIVEILAFYDELRRRDKTITAFARLMSGSLETSADIDRGAERLLRLTRFLAAAFTLFEERVRVSGRIDEHGLRALLIGGTSEQQPPAYRQIVVTVPDQAADPNGLWLADYDLLARLPGLERLDLIATEGVLAAGFHQRVHDVLPGIHEERSGVSSARPLLAAPEPADEEPTPWIVSRDREEELAGAVRSIKQSGPRDLERTAIVYQRPLPYLYLAAQVFADAEIPYQALDALPLASEPFAAAIDLVLSFLSTEATRASLVELLASPHWSFEDDAGPCPVDVAGTDALLREMKYVGGWERLAALAAEAADRSAGAGSRASSVWRRAAGGLAAAARAALELREVVHGDAASRQVSALRAFIAGHERLPAPSDGWHARHLRARGAILAALQGLAEAHRLHDDQPVPLPELAGMIRRWIEGQTFSPRTGVEGVLLLDAPAAAYADVDEVRLVGLVESDWPDRARRSIFYPSSLLAQLGWPLDSDRLSGACARFHDLLRLARTRVTVSLFTLEDDGIVSPSSFLEEIASAGLPIERFAPVPAARVFTHEALADEPVVPSALAGGPLQWLGMRASRSPAGDAMFHGGAGVRGAAVYAVSKVERYLECPFKYFAAHVLKLPEERDEESGLSAQERGQFLHGVFEQFFTLWQARGHGSMTVGNLNTALTLFEEVAEAALVTLPEADRSVERTHLLGSAAAPGLAQRAFTFEIEQGGEVVERLLEYELEGEFVFASSAGSRPIRLRAKADRIDLLANGTLRVIDYKLGKAPKAARALQLPVYGVCAEQSLEGRHGKSWTLAQAGYVAFRERNAFVELGGSSSLGEAIAAGQERLLAAIDRIERGEFPPAPDEPFICTHCGYASVCRKDYVGDE